MLRFGDVATELGVSVDDAHFLHFLGALPARDAWAVSGPTFDRAAVERCRRWLADQEQGPAAVLARLRAERHAEPISPDGLVSPAGAGIAWNSYGPYDWQRAVTSGLGAELNKVRTAAGMAALEDVALLPAEWRQTTNFYLTPDQIVHVALFVGEAASAWGIGKVLDQLETVIGRVSMRNSRYWKRRVAQAFWFVISIWHAAGRFWAVIASDVSPEHAADYAQLETVYRKIVRSQDRAAARHRVAEGEAIVVLVRNGSAQEHSRRFPNIDQALRELGRVKVVSSGGPLEALWAAAHPGSSAGLRVCQLLQDRAGEHDPIKDIAVMAKVGTSTVREVLRELALMGAPVRQEAAGRWLYDPRPAAGDPAVQLST